MTKRHTSKDLSRLQSKGLGVSEGVTDCRFVIGIDCGTVTGFAVWDREKKKLLFVGSGKIHRFIYEFQKWLEVHRGDFFVRVEDARKRKWIPPKKTEAGERGRREGAGYVKRDAVIWEDLFTDLKIPFELVAPKNNKTKMSAEYFRKVTGWENPTNEHGRDAGALVIGY